MEKIKPYNKMELKVSDFATIKKNLGEGSQDIVYLVDNKQPTILK